MDLEQKFHSITVDVTRFMIYIRHTCNSYFLHSLPTITYHVCMIYINILHIQVSYNSGKQTWHIELMATLEANNNIILHQNIFDIIDICITDLPDAIGTILGQKN